MALCARCGAHIPDINVEFGGGAHEWSGDGDLYCTRACMDGLSADMTVAFAPGGHLSTDEEARRYVLGQREASVSQVGRSVWPPPPEAPFKSAPTPAEWPWQRIALGMIGVVLIVVGIILAMATPR